MDATTSPVLANVSQHDIPTPPAPSVAPSHRPSPLPQPRHKPLPPGGPKESELIRYLDHKITSVKGRWARRMFTDEEAGHAHVQGYLNFKEAATDIDGLIDVVWVSGTPNLQKPYLFTIALMVVDFLPDFKPAPIPTFRILNKLDHAFCGLLQGKDSTSGDPLPGFESGPKVTTTEKVRLKSIVERTRLTVVEILSREIVEEDEGRVLVVTDDESRTEASGGEETVKFQGFEDYDDSEDEDEREEMHIAKVYERTLSELSDELGGPPIGIITED